MSSVAPRSRWRFVIAPRWLAWHAFVVIAVVGMLWLGDWQLRRAQGGNALSWAYTFEWPVFAVFGLVFWVKTLLDEAKPKQADPGGDAVTTAGGVSALGLPAVGAQRPAPDDEPDPELDEYNAYLSQLSKQGLSKQGTDDGSRTGLH
jgi:hypothetical protein